MKHNILITGGAGYIGSHVVKLLGETTNHNLIILDDLSTGHEKSVLFGKLIKGDIADTTLLSQIIKNNNINTVMHFAASISVGESAINPEKYYFNNVAKSIVLINECLKHKVEKFIFSSTGSLYGNSQAELLSEDTPVLPVNTYSKTKLIVENIIKDVAGVHKNFKYGILRYFNAAGASMDGKIGLITENASHLIKVACEHIVGKRNQIQIYGTDYPTKDGTCIRDYIHIEDLASAHISVLNYLNSNPSNLFNVGYGVGATVKDVLNLANQLIDKKMTIVESSRREGDPIRLIADNSKILSLTDWKPKYNDLSLIIKSAIDWEKSQLKSK